MIVTTIYAIVTVSLWTSRDQGKDGDRPRTSIGTQNDVWRTEVNTIISGAYLKV